MMDKKNIFLWLILALLLGISIGLHLTKREIKSHQRRLLLFSPPAGKTDQTIDIIKRIYVDSISVKMLEEEAIRGVLKNLDPHSQYIPASNFAAVNESLEGNFSGIGVQYNMLNDTIVIVNTTPEGPSEKVGILAGDRIISVEDKNVAGVRMASDDIVNMLKGITGTSVNVGVYRRGEEELLNFTITRDRIPLFSIIAAYMINGETGYIKIDRFARTTYQEFLTAADKLRDEGMSKLIIDLRDNSGGIIEGAVRLAELFLPAGKMIVYTEGSKTGRVNYYSQGINKTYHNMELVLLINETSASASEIVAGAIQDNDRGTIIGRRSFGKGLVQEQHVLSDGSAVRITVSRYYTPTGRCIQKPYNTDDRNEYFNELNSRIAHGELMQQENIRFNDSLRYETPAGKVVYGGGGIMPDIFVPLDTTGISNYYRMVMRRRLAYDFAFYYADNNRKELATHTDCKTLQTHLKNKNILSAFVDYAARNGVAKNDRDIRISGNNIENTVMAYIARNILNENGFYSVINQMDKIVLKGVEKLKIEN